MTKTNILLESGTNELEIIEFIISFTSRDGKEISQSYGINVAKVREIIRMPEITVLPNMPESIIGVFNMRSQIISAMDLRNYLYGQPNNSENRTMIIAEFNGNRFGFMVDAVTRIYRFSWQQVEAPNIVNSFAGDKSTIVGIVKLEDKNILLLDVEKIVVDLQPELGIKALTEKQQGIFHGKVAYIADDSPTIRNMILTQLRSAGFEVVPFSDGSLAWEHFEKLVNEGANARHPDLLVTDIEMPQMDGYSLCKRVKQHPMLSHIPVVIFSSLVNDDVIHKGRAVGADIQLTKPQLVELVDRVREYLAAQGQAVEPAV